VKKKGSRKKTDSKSRKVKPPESIADALSMHEEIVRLNKALEKSDDSIESLEERVQDIEIHMNLLTRLLTTLCIEKFGMRIGVLKRLIKRIEKEAIRDSQILHLESLYSLPSNASKRKNNSSSRPSPKDDPWDDIS